MKSAKVVVIIGFVAASTSLLLFLQQASSKPKATQRVTRYRVKKSSTDVYVRNKMAGFVLGTLFENDAVDVQKTTTTKTWGYGMA
ncbi:MAG: hypothetical protein M3347_04425, partial [Armatimonadota bacterium]|nr:hypothetical protein [Armatimonadota bacterium]